MTGAVNFRHADSKPLRLHWKCFARFAHDMPEAFNAMACKISSGEYLRGLSGLDSVVNGGAVLRLARLASET